MQIEKMTISLEEFLAYLLKKWKIIAVIVFACVGIFAGTAKMFGGEISVPHSEEYLHYEQELAWHESYLKDSVLMNIDPTSIYQRTVLLRNIADREVLRTYVTSLEIWDDFQTEWVKTYFPELVTWTDLEVTGTVELTLRHATSEECLEAAEYLQEKIVEQDEQAEIIIGAEKIVTDETLQEEHLRWYSRIDYVNSLLLDSQAGYTLKVSMPAAILTGALAGGVFAIFMLLLCYIVKGKSGK